MKAEFTIFQQDRQYCRKKFYEKQQHEMLDYKGCWNVRYGDESSLESFCRNH